MESRPQAGPLPQKRGEIGYTENAQPSPVEEPALPSLVVTMPARHPMDTSPVPSESPPTAQGQSPSPAAATNAEAEDPMPMQKPNRRGHYAGIRISSWVRFSIQLTVLISTIVAWVLIIVLLGSKLSAGSPPTLENPTGSLPSDTATIFVYVAFAVACLAQLLFLERAIFHMRAERYCYLHPECRVSPDGFVAARGVTPGMSFAPWNRLPLPTYAAALALSGHGTGDVEDNIIAVPPPPAYGNTRDSTLVLAGNPPNHLRHSRVSHRQAIETIPESRPVSYMTIDEHWEERQNAERARQLEETLARLEESSGSTDRVSGNSSTTN